MPASMVPDGASGRTRRRVGRVLRVLAYLLTLPILAWVGQMAIQLIQEVRALRQEQYADEHSRLVGYLDINPLPSFADPPGDWFHVGGDGGRLWVGWDEELGHLWFPFEPGDLDAGRLSHCLGRDTLRAIDRGILEDEGGERWGRVPQDAVVYFLDVHGDPTAYPALILEKVQVVNEVVEGVPVVMTHSPYAPIDHAVDAYDARHEGRRLTHGSAGYLYGGRPLLYDRGTQSLWVPEAECLAALSGPLRGTRLPRHGQPVATTWGDWSRRHPDGHLLVGADRSGPVPDR